jgi:micrococcal nuclease
MLFRRRKHDFGRVLPSHRWQGLTWRQRLGSWLRAGRPWAGLVLLLAGVHFLYRVWHPPLAPLNGTRLTVQPDFHRCGQGRGANCVVDGDTFIMTKRHFRIIGIDAPETGAKARCPVEAQLAEQASAELLRLLNQGPFTLQPPQDGLRDDYGRELMTVTRTRADGKVQDIAEDLVASGLVHRYGLGHPRGGWC